MQAELFDQFRGVVIAAAAAIGVDQSLGVLAQSVPAFNDVYLMQLAEKGGGWVVLLIVLYFYRRDFSATANQTNEMRKELLDAVNKQAESEQKLAIALAENTEVMRAIRQDQR